MIAIDRWFLQYSSMSVGNLVGGKLEIYVQPRASKTEIVGMHGSALKIRLAAPPVDGAANQAVIEFIADRLKVSKGTVRIVSGASSRRKLIEVSGWTTERLREALCA
jgi:uncharacterized protein (TIGR00251 family)